MFFFAKKKKLIKQVFPAYLPEALTYLTVWKRFNEVKKLQKFVQKRHKELHLRGIVPDIKDDRYFRRFEPDVISERKLYILRLLDFVGQYSALYKSHAFQSFFEVSHTPPHEEVYTNFNYPTLRPVSDRGGQSDSDEIGIICHEVDIPRDLDNRSVENLSNLGDNQYDSVMTISSADDTLSSNESSSDLAAGKNSFNNTNSLISFINKFSFCQ